MHSKRKGSIAEMKVAADLMEKGYFVFTELGDLSPIDFIAVKENKLIRVQVKWAKVRYSGVGELDLRRCMTDYLKVYTKDDVDVFALYLHEVDKIAYITWDDLGERTRISIRYQKSNNGQVGNPLENYMGL